MDYAWDSPAARDKKLLLNINESSRVVDIMEIGNLVPFKFMASLISASSFKDIDFFFLSIISAQRQYHSM
jgi:hypothetical protein